MNRRFAFSGSHLLPVFNLFDSGERSRSDTASSEQGILGRRLHAGAQAAGKIGVAAFEEQFHIADESQRRPSSVVSPCAHGSRKR